MTDYLIVNASGSELTNVNVGGTDVPAGTVSAAVTLTAAELAAVLVADSVAVINVTSDAAEKTAIAALLHTSYGSNVSVFLANVTGSTVGGVTTGKIGSASVTTAALIAALAAGCVAAGSASTTEQRRKGVRLLTHGSLPGLEQA